MSEKLCECGCGQATKLAKITDRRCGQVKGQPVRFVNGHNLRGLPSPNIKHGMDGTPECTAYNHAKLRCTNPNAQAWENYGGRGIKFLFTSFEQFFAELGPRPEGMTLDRIENDGNYEPGNVRWATPSAQNANKRYRPWSEERRKRHGINRLREVRSGSTSHAVEAAAAVAL